MYNESFLKFLQYEKRYSLHTILSYKNDLNQLILYLSDAEQNNDIAFTNHKIIRGWITHLISNGYSTKSVARKISTLKSYYKFLMREGFIETNPMNKVLSPKIEKKLPVFLEQESFNDFLDTFEYSNDFEGIRNRLILEMFYATGIRCSELINLETKNIDEDNCAIKVNGKRNKERIIPYSPALSLLIKKYGQQRSKILMEIPNEFFFITKKGKPIYSRLAYRVVNQFLQYASTIEKKSPHILRHTYATHILNNGADLNAVKELLGHANLSATQIYTHNTFEKLKNSYKQAHPRA